MIQKKLEISVLVERAAPPMGLLNQPNVQKDLIVQGTLPTPRNVQKGILVMKQDVPVQISVIHAQQAIFVTWKA